MATVEEFAGLLARNITEDGMIPTPVPRLGLIRASMPTLPLHTLHEPAVCIIAQGRKRVVMGDRALIYDPRKYLIVSVDAACMGEVIEAGPEAPYLCFRFDIDRTLLREVISAAGMAGPEHFAEASAMMLSTANEDLLESAARLVRLIDSPRDIPVLGPLAEREFLFRLLKGEQGRGLAQIAHADSRLNQVHRAIEFIKSRFREPIRVSDVAEAARMSPSALHQHFKTVTAMSPLQFQKQMRLLEARRLMLGERSDAAGAAFAVGYESPSQFSREYARMFGRPPARDVAILLTQEDGLRAQA
jgi:AraC-like DNA-binding protein